HRRLVADVLVHADLFLTPVRGSARSLQVAIDAIVGQRDQTVHDGLRVGVYGDNVTREGRAGGRIFRQDAPRVGNGVKVRRGRVAFAEVSLSHAQGGRIGVEDGRPLSILG